MIDQVAIRNWFNQHPNVRIVLKYGILGLAGGTLYVATSMAVKVPVAVAPLYTAFLALLNEKLQVLSPLEPWPIIGSLAPDPFSTLGAQSAPPRVPPKQ